MSAGPKWRGSGEYTLSTPTERSLWLSGTQIIERAFTPRDARRSMRGSISVSSQ